MPRQHPRRSRKNKYKIWNSGQLISGSAEEVLRRIHESARADSGISNLSLEDYASELVESAPFFVPRAILGELDLKDTRPLFDRAVDVLTSMPASGVVVINKPGLGE